MIKKILVISLVFGSFSCEKPPPKLSNLNKREVKAMVNDSMMIKRKTIDSLCNAQSKTLVNHLVDSILEIRHQQINKKLGAIK